MDRFVPDEELKRASKIGANEDIIHTSKNDEGYDLRTRRKSGLGSRRMKTAMRERMGADGRIRKSSWSGKIERKKRKMAVSPSCSLRVVSSF
ncbi:hypothetical protein [Geobacillus stearothermophilus]|uniref:hypothetical protein n=1 Tax=Geobacillus stearothermophilus TaxID=1422 RepID=UPI002E21049C|nr:hypothetical protein [Geobacillus stearothermophilus]